jgi:hypothetical protein
VQALLVWQLAAPAAASRPVLDDAFFRQAQARFAELYLGRHRQLNPAPELRKLMDKAFDALAALLTGLAQLPLRGTPATGPISWDLAALTRDPQQPWDEERALDLCVRYWQQARAAGLALPEDFGEFYKALEWTGVQQHLSALGDLAAAPQAAPDAAFTHLAHWVRAGAGRYRELKVLQRLVEQAEGIRDNGGYAFGRV